MTSRRCSARLHILHGRLKFSKPNPRVAVGPCVPDRHKIFPFGGGRRDRNPKMDVIIWGNCR